MSSSTIPVSRIPVHDVRRLRSELRRAMPPEAFQPQPLRGVIALALVPVMVALGGWAASGRLPWWACLLISFTLGQLLVVVGFAAHEALHHSVFRSRVLEDVLGWVGFGPWLVTPGLWRAWHVQAHHSAANIHGRDPDILPYQDEWHTERFARLFHAISPGSGRWLSYISFGLFFTAQGQVFLWHYSRLPRFQHVRMHRTRERCLSVLLALGWVSLGVAMGLKGAFYALILPQLFSNITLMLYIATNHWLQPASEDTDNPFINTASVRSHPAVDWLHLNFSYHQEHHVFPAMSPRFAPLLREKLRALSPEASIVYPHLRALRMLFQRPPLYAADGHTLVGPRGTPSVSTAALREALEAAAPLEPDGMGQPERGTVPP